MSTQLNSIRQLFSTKRGRAGFAALLSGLALVGSVGATASGDNGAQAQSNAHSVAATR